MLKTFFTKELLKPSVDFDLSSCTHNRDPKPSVPRATVVSYRSSRRNIVGHDPSKDSLTDEERPSHSTPILFTWRISVALILF